MTLVFTFLAEHWVWTIVGLLIAFLIWAPLITGAVLISERQVGVVVKRWGGRGLEPGRLIALAGEAGYQADTLAPGLHFGFWRWQYRIIKVPVTVVPQGEIALRRSYTYSESEVLARNTQEQRLLKEMEQDAVQQLVRRLQAAQKPA